MNPALERLPDYPFARLRALLAGLEPPAGVEPVLMSVGEPQHPMPAFAGEILARHVGEWNRYPPLGGTEALRAAAARWLVRRFALPEGMIDPGRMIAPLSGTREGLFRVAQLMTDGQTPGRNLRPAIALPDPYYAPYGGGAVLAGAEPVFLPTSAATGFLPDLDALAADAALLERLVLLYVCNPSNPQGALADGPYLDRLLALARRHGFVVAADECYAEIYDTTRPVSILEAAARDGGALANLLVFHSLSKRSNAAGLRSGFLVGDPRLVAGYQKIANYAAASIPLPIQAASAALWDDDAHVVENRALYCAKFDAAEQRLAGRFGFRRPPGGFFLWLDVGNGEAAARRLWAEAGLRTLPGAYLSSTGDAAVGGRYLRVAVVHETATVAAALDRLSAVLTREPLESAA